VIVILKASQREIGTFPEEIRSDLADALARLDAGLALSMPLSRPMPGIGRGVHELRLKDRSGQYRVVYALPA
jgi:phage-related protein